MVIFLKIKSKKTKKRNRTEYMRKWYLKNKEKIDSSNRKYIKTEKGKKSKRKANRKYNKTEAGKKKYRISNWKKRGLKNINIIKYILSEKFQNLGNGFYNDKYNTLYRLYTIQKKCSVCYKVFNTENRMDLKCVDHDHQSGFMRRICCGYCNIHVIK